MLNCFLPKDNCRNKRIGFEIDTFVAHRERFVNEVNCKEVHTFVYQYIGLVFYPVSNIVAIAVRELLHLKVIKRICYSTSD